MRGLTGWARHAKVGTPTAHHGQHRDEYQRTFTSQETRECLLSEWLDYYGIYSTQSDWELDCARMEAAERGITIEMAHRIHNGYGAGKRGVK